MCTTEGLSDAKGDSIPQEAPTSFEACSEVSRPTVLMADADRLTAWALRHFLRTSHRVVHVATAAEATEQLERGPTHALIVSDNLPHREADGLIATALQRRPGLTIIKLVSLVDEEHKEIAQTVRVVEKPFDLAHMKRLLEQTPPAGPACDSDRPFHDGAP